MGTIKHLFNGHDNQTYSIDFDNKYILIGYRGGMVHLHNRSNNDRKEINNHNGCNVTSVCLNQHYAVSASDDHTVQLFDLKTMKTTQTLKHSNRVICVSFGPANTWLANKIISCSWDKTLGIW